MWQVCFVIFDEQRAVYHWQKIIAPQIGATLQIPQAMVVSPIIHDRLRIPTDSSHIPAPKGARVGNSVSQRPPSWVLALVKERPTPPLPPSPVRPFMSHPNPNAQISPARALQIELSPTYVPPNPSCTPSSNSSSFQLKIRFKFQIDMLQTPSLLLKLNCFFFPVADVSNFQSKMRCFPPNEKAIPAP